MEDRAKALRLKLAEVLPFLNETQRRVLAASEAKSYGRGGIQLVARLTGLCRQTIYNGLADLKAGRSSARIRRSGGGRKKLQEQTPELVETIETLLAPVTRSDPESTLRWTCKSVRNVEQGLLQCGYSVSYRTVARILPEQEYHLQSNRKTSEGKKDHPDRDQQFRYINDQAKRFLRGGKPVISVDTKKKELVGNYTNTGREWAKNGRAVEVLSHDFPDPEVPKAVPYGIYDIGKNTGWVNIGVDADTAEFAVESIGSGGGGWARSDPNTRRPYASARTAAAAMAIGCASGNENFRSWPISTSWRSRCATSRRARASGTRLNIASFRISA